MMNLLSDQVLVRIPSAFETLKYQCYLVRPEGLFVYFIVSSHNASN